MLGAHCEFLRAGEPRRSKGGVVRCVHRCMMHGVGRLVSQKIPRAAPAGGGHGEFIT